MSAQAVSDTLKAAGYAADAIGNFLQSAFNLAATVVLALIGG